MASLSENKKFHLINEYVCTRLKLHGEQAKQLLIDNEWTEAGLSDAETIFINTCAFLSKKEEQAADRIRALGENKRTTQDLVVFGCLPFINPGILDGMEVDYLTTRGVSGFIEKYHLANKETKISHNFERKLNKLSQINRLLNKALFHDSYFEYLYEPEKACHLQIASGCSGSCSFCCEKLARGKLSSRPVAEIMTEFKKGYEQGFRIFSLNADDVGVYGKDKDENVAALIEEILNQGKDFKLVLTEFNPWGLIRYREKMTKLLQSPQIVFITIPLQSGSQKILQWMKRPYRVDEVMEIVREVKSANPQLKINTHLITGFPGETEKDFQSSLNLVKTSLFNKLKVFNYSDRQGTQSSQMAGKISEKEKDRRKSALISTHLLQLASRLDLKGILLNLGSYY